MRVRRLSDCPAWVTTEQISRDRFAACVDLWAPETSPGVNALLEGSRLSVWSEREVINTLTSSTSDKRSSDLHVKAPKLGQAGVPPKPTLKVKHSELLRLLSQVDGLVHPRYRRSVYSFVLGLSARWRWRKVFRVSFDISRMYGPNPDSTVDDDTPCVSQLDKREPGFHR